MVNGIAGNSRLSEYLRALHPDFQRRGYVLWNFYNSL